MLAEVMDPVWKTLFDEMEMDARLIAPSPGSSSPARATSMTRADFRRATSAS
jgi:hypothetical protein